MRLNHLDLYVPNVVETAAFFITHFNFRKKSAPSGARLEVLVDDADFELVISAPVPAFGGTDQVRLKAETYHIGFLQEQKKDVDAVYKSLCLSGAQISGEPRAIRGGWLFYCIAPGRILIEIGWRPDS
jgi:predicted enzyme related to lactoylglutathione lyase